MKFKFTVLGSTGFIGSSMINFLQKNNIEYDTPNMRQRNIFDHNLGNIIYAIGVSDFLNHPYDAVDAHVCLLKNLLEPNMAP